MLSDIVIFRLIPHGSCLMAHCLFRKVAAEGTFMTAQYNRRQKQKRRKAKVERKKTKVREAASKGRGGKG
jgi:hypothetical protein